LRDQQTSKARFSIGWNLSTEGNRSKSLKEVDKVRAEKTVNFFGAASQTITL
jgi:hypothetical protein